MRRTVILMVAMGAGAALYGQQYGQPYGQTYGQPYPEYRGGYGYNYGNEAARIGYQDGLRHGERDLYTGHSFRPTHDGDFKHADRGYHHYFGPKWQYKEAYRDAYLRGYERGYGNRGQYRRGYRY